MLSDARSTSLVGRSLGSTAMGIQLSPLEMGTVTQWDLENPWVNSFSLGQDLPDLGSPKTLAPPKSRTPPSYKLVSQLNLVFPDDCHFTCFTFSENPATVSTLQYGNHLAMKKSPLLSVASSGRKHKNAIVNC